MPASNGGRRGLSGHAYDTFEVFMLLFRSKRVDTALKIDAKRILANLSLSVTYLEHCLWTKSEDILEDQISVGGTPKVCGIR